MKLLIVRHGDPDYSIDSLTEKGWREAELLSKKLSKLDIKDFYVSTMGRAKDTASCTLKKMNRTATECDWLREFDVLIHRPDVPDRKICAWDWLPQDWTQDERFYQYDHWFENEAMQEANMKYYYDQVTGEFDKVLAEHGYVRDGHYYRVEKANNDTLVFFCHFGLGCVLISHLLSMSPMVLWHNTVSYTHLRAHETGRNLVCRLLLEKKKKNREKNEKEIGKETTKTRERKSNRM